MSGSGDGCCLLLGQNKKKLKGYEIVEGDKGKSGLQSTRIIRSRSIFKIYILLSMAHVPTICFLL